MKMRLSWLAVMLCLYVAPQCLAQPNYFWNGTSGAYTNASKWSFNSSSPAGPPAAGDRALFLSGSGFLVSANGSPAQVTVQGSIAAFSGVIAPQGNVTGFPSIISGFDVGLTGFGQATFQGSGAALNSAAPVTIGAGSGGDGTLKFILGATGFATGNSNSGAVNVASHPAGIGAMTIDGVGSAFTATGTFDLGGRNVGTVTVTSSGSLHTNGIEALNQAGLNIGGSTFGATGAIGILNISDGGTVHNELQTNIGLYGNGFVNISSGSFTSTDGNTTNPAISIARFTGSHGHLNVSGTGHVVSDGELILGGDGIGTMTITDQGLVESNVTVGSPAIVGFGSNSNGLATINGVDAQWTVTDALTVGQLGTGEVDLVSGGTLFLKSTPTVDDPYIYIGNAAGSHGKISVTNEFSFLDASNITTEIGRDQFAVGQLEISDKGQAFLQRTTIGDAGTGDLSVNSNGTLATGIAVLGLASTGVGTATIETGAEWEVIGDIHIGVEGSGSLYVENTSTLTVDGFISVGESPGGIGLLQINGANATVNGTYTSVTIGLLGNGQLELNNGANWSVNTNVTMAEILVSQGTATIDATSQWKIAGSLYVGGSAVATGGTGQLNVAGLVTADTAAKIWDSSSALLINGGRIKTPLLTVRGTLAGNGTVEADQAINDGIVAPERTGATTGRITFTGDYIQTSTGTLNIQLGGTIPLTEFDQVVIDGTASLDGALHVELTDIGLGAFEPSLDDQFVILTAQAFNPLLSHYNPANITLPELPQALGWDVFYTATELVLQVILPGDYNDNGIVDAGDYVVWRKYFGTTHDLPNDPIGGVIGAGQFSLWRARFGNMPSGSGTTFGATIPEPTSLMLFALALFVAACNRQRYRTA